MRFAVILGFACITASLTSCSPGGVRAQQFDLGDLMEIKTKMPAPAAIVAAILELEKDGLEDDRRQQLWSDDDSLVAVARIDLDGDGMTDYLAYPRTLLPSFHGAHSIAFWVFKGSSDNKYRLVLSGRQDAVRILGSGTKGMRDIELVYYAAEREVTRYSYDGQQYKKVSQSGLDCSTGRQ